MWEMNYSMIQALCAIYNSGEYDRDNCQKQLHDAIDMLNELYDIMERFAMHGRSIRYDTKEKAFRVLWKYYRKYHQDTIDEWEKFRKEREQAELRKEN